MKWFRTLTLCYFIVVYFGLIMFRAVDAYGAALIGVYFLLAIYIYFRF
jgi:hypothetical protein